MEDTRDLHKKHIKNWYYKKLQNATKKHFPFMKLSKPAYLTDDFYDTVKEFADEDDQKEYHKDRGTLACECFDAYTNAIKNIHDICSNISKKIRRSIKSDALILGFMWVVIILISVRLGFGLSFYIFTDSTSYLFATVETMTNIIGKI